MDRFDPFVKYADVYGDVINWEKDPMNYPKNQNKYFFSDGKTYYEQICKMLRLMSVFKEAFNQIYDNEDEISGAWESFVENLSATAVSGSEPGVTLTWTDDSVNFEFTLVPGRDGANGTDGRDGTDGVGISSISFNSDYTMTITLTNGSVYTSESLRGPIGETGATGPQGEKGEPGEGLNILDVYPTLQDLQTAHPTGSPGEAYQVGTAPSFTLYIWSVSQSRWVPAGTLGSVSPSMSNPLMDGEASAGSSDLYARGDHVHPTDTSRASASALNNLSDTIISEYLKKTDAVGYNDILTKTLAQSLYQTISGMTEYLKKTDAVGYDDILTKTLAQNLYQTIAGMSDYLTKIEAQTLYQTINGMSAYLTKVNAQTLYQVILQSGVNIKTINNQSLVGPGNIDIQGGLTIDLMWTNSSPNSVFAAQTINLNLSEYKLCLIEYQQVTTNSNYFGTAICAVGGQTELFSRLGGFFSGRQVTVMTNGVAFDDAGKQIAFGENSTDNARSIPYKIYGIK